MKFGFLLIMLSVMLLQSNSEHIDLAKGVRVDAVEIRSISSIIMYEYESFYRVAKVCYIKEEVMKHIMDLITKIITSPKCLEILYSYRTTIGAVNQMLYEISKKISIVGKDEKFDASEKAKGRVVVFIDYMQYPGNDRKFPSPRYAREEEYDRKNLENADTTTFFPTTIWALRSVIFNKRQLFPPAGGEFGRKYFEGRTEEQIKQELEWYNSLIKNMPLLWGLEGLRAFCLILAHAGANPLEENNPFNDLLRRAQSLEPDPDLIIDRIQATMPEKGKSSWLSNGVKMGIVGSRRLFGAIAHLGSSIFSPADEATALLASAKTPAKNG